MSKSLVAVLAFALSGSAALAAPLPVLHGIDAERELMITDLSVVNDVRAKYPGSWSFGRLMENLAGQVDPARFTLEWAEQLAADQEINGFLVPLRDGFVQRVLNPWREQSKANGIDGLDLSVAPFRLLGIVNRIDLRQNSGYGSVNNAGEMRFAFSILDAHEGGDTTLGTLIIEFNMPAKTSDAVRTWAKRWHALSAYRLGSAAYLGALESLTLAVTEWGLAGPNLAQLRTNELLDAPPWQWGEFKIQKDGYLRRVVVAQTPDSSLNDTKAFADYVNENEAAILAGQHVVPLEFRGQPFQGGVSNGGDISLHFRAPGIRNNEARHIVSFNTCVACHTEETGSGFFHMGPRNANIQTSLSQFLTGGSVIDPVDGKTVRKFSDIARRQKGLYELLNASNTKIATDPSLKRVH